MTHALMNGDLTIAHGPAWIRVWHRRSARDLSELDDVLAALDAALVATGWTRILFDSRDAAYEGGAVQEKMWAWLTNHPRLTSVATLVRSEMLATSVNLTGLSKGVKIRAFHSEDAASEWLARP